MMETPLIDILAEDACLDKPAPPFSSAKVVSPFKPSRIAGLRFQQSSFSLKRVFLKLFLPYCLAITLKSRKIPNHRLQSMATTNFNNRLITPELTEALSSYPLYSQDAKKKDAMCIAVFYLGNIRWYIMEGQQEGNDFTLYGIVAGLQETEYGYQSATEMASITYDASEYGLGTLRIEQDKDFKPCKLADIKDEELQLFLSRLYDKD